MYRFLVLVILMSPWLAHADPFRCQVHGHTEFRDVPCDAQSDAPPRAHGATPAAPHDREAEPPEPVPPMYLCVSRTEEFVFQSGGCERGWRPLRAEYREEPGGRVKIARVTREADAHANAFGDEPDPTAAWTQHVRVPDEVVHEVMRLPTLAGKYRITASSDVDGVRRVASGTACLTNARPFDFLDVRQLARSAPYLPRECRLDGWNATAGRVEYRLVCAQRGRIVIGASVLTMSRELVRHERKVAAAAPSDFVRGDRSYELRRLGDCE